MKYQWKKNVHTQFLFFEDLQKFNKKCIHFMEKLGLVNHFAFFC